MKNCKTIAEYAILKWMEKHNFVINEFSITVNKNIGTITDKTGTSMTVEYKPETKTVEELDSKKGGSL